MFAVLYKTRPSSPLATPDDEFEWHDFCSTIVGCADDAKAHAATYHVGAGLKGLLMPGIFELVPVKEKDDG